VPSSQLPAAPVTVLEALDEDGRPAKYVTVTVRALTGHGGLTPSEAAGNRVRQEENCRA